MVEKRPQPSYQNGKVSEPKVARLVEERGTTRGNFMAVVKKAATSSSPGTGRAAVSKGTPSHTAKERDGD